MSDLKFERSIKPIDRPIEPYCSSDNPNQWQEVLSWEIERADMYEEIILTFGEYFHWVDSGDSEEVLKAQDKCVQIYRFLKGEGDV